MRPLFSSILFFSLLAASLVHAAPAANSPGIVGEWQCNDTAHEGVCVLRFNSDGTFDGHVGIKNERQVEFAGTWEQIDDRILYTYKQPSSWSKDEDKILELEPSHLLLQSKSGVHRRYYRIDGKNKNTPNQSPEPTPTAVTPPAGQEARQP